MSKVIYKYQPEKALDRFKIPLIAKVIWAGYQNGVLTLWAEVDPSDDPSVEIQYAVLPTGAVVPGKDWSHLTTVFDGPFVWHVYTREISC